MVEHIKEVLIKSRSKKDLLFAKDNLTEEEKDNFFKILDSDSFKKFISEEEMDMDWIFQLAFNMYSSEQAQERIKNINKLELRQQVAVISCLPSDEEKLKYLFPQNEDFEDANACIISSLSNNLLKLEKLSLLKDEENKSLVLETLSTDELKVQSLSLLSDDYSKASVISSFTSDELKVQSLSLLSDDHSKASVISSFTSDELKVQSLSLLSDDYSKASVISSFASDELKIQSLSNLSNDYSKEDVISSFTSDELKVQSLSLLSDDSNKARVIRSIASDELKLKGLISIYLTWFEKERDKGMSKKLKILEEYQKLFQGINFLIDSFIDYIKRNQECLDEKSITQIAGVLHQFDISNSLELSNLKQQIAPLVLSSSNPVEKFNEIEEIFLKNNLPMMGKIFLCFQLLYPNFEKEENGIIVFNFDENSRMSPELIHPTQTRRMKAVEKNATDKDIRFQIVFNDLVRIASRSNNRSLIEYLNNIEYGNTLFLGISKGIIKFDDLDNHSKQILDIFSNHLVALYEHTKKGSKETFENLSIVEKNYLFFSKI